LADLAADAVALFAEVIAQGSHLFTLLTFGIAQAAHLVTLFPAEFPRLLPRLFSGCAGLFSGLDSSLTGLTTPLIEALPAACGGEQSYSQQTKDQQFHGVIDEGSPDLFRKISALQNGGFLDRPAVGETLHIQIFSVYNAGLAVENQVGQNAAGGGRMHHPVPAETIGEV
jgi:hypothetical protein